MATRTLEQSLAGLTRITVALMAGWLALVGASLGWNVRENDSRAVDLANAEAKAYLKKDLAFRRWATQQGGLYVRVSPQTQPSPHMAHVPERDVTTATGVALTLYNPATLLRLVMETQSALYGTKARITGVQFLNPANAPDEWEAKALGVIARTGADFSEVVSSDGTPAVRRMQPMFMEAGCEKCHAWTGLKPGELRGGTDVAIPLEPYLALQRTANRELVATHGGVLLLGLGFIGFISVRRRSILKETSAHQAKLGQLELAVDQSASAILIMRRDGTVLYANQRLLELCGYSAAELVGGNFRLLRPAAPEEAAMWAELDAGRDWRGEFEHRTRAGASRQWTASASAVKDNQGGPTTFLAVFEDVTEHRRAEAEKVRLEARLQQAQRMETIGQLAGGVAHDFNNQLGVILGNTEVALRQVDPRLPIHEDLEEVRRAALRSGDLTRQLLAFARRQPVAPKVLDLTQTVPRMLGMLRRLIGEAIELSWEPRESLWPTHLDPSQMDHILTNLCVNARDAIAGVGTICLTADNQRVDAAFCATQLEAAPGDYVRLAVSDTGSGMAGPVLAQLFEPFFTTKELGKGTGLGLATVYGSVRQAGGFVTVASEPGKGSRFDVYLPRYQGEQEPETDVPSGARSPGGGETVLVVEDLPSLRRLTCRALEAKGYTVLGAASPEHARRQAQEHPGRIDLLLSDVVLPQMSGAQLADELGALRPGLKVLLMSGYAATGLPEKHANNFLEKPFSLDTLARKVREALDRS